MKVDPHQEELDLQMQLQPLDEFVLKAQLLLGRPEVEYTLSWRSRDGVRRTQKCYCDAVWPMDKMSARILSLIFSVGDGGPWKLAQVRSVLDAVQSAYGCEEPF